MQFKQVRVKAKKDADGILQIDVDSPDVAGFIQVPREETEPLVLDLSTLNISAIPDESDPLEVDTADFPPLAVSVKSLLYQNRAWAR